MVEQGDLIYLNFTPQAGHEQTGRRPALVVSNNFFNRNTALTIVCPITTRDNGFPLHVSLDERTRVRGFIMCEHVKSVDLKARGYEQVDRLPQDLLERVIQIIGLEIKVSM